MTDIRAGFSNSYGFRIPESFVELYRLRQQINLDKAVNVAWFDVEANDEAAVARRPHMNDYATWLPEFFPIMSTGCDGIGYGFVVHAPELDQHEWPVFERNPSNYDEARLVFFGATLREALETMVSHDPGYVAQSDEEALSADYRALAAELGLSLERKQFVRRTTGAEIYVPRTPPGWKFVGCRDMVGSLAPADAFAADNPHWNTYLAEANGNREEARTAMIAYAKAMLHEGFPGSALVAIRCVYATVPWEELPEQLEILELWAWVYAALGRPLLEAAVRDRIVTKAKCDDEYRESTKIEIVVDSRRNMPSTNE